MSLTILTAPSDYSAVSNEMLFIVQESTKANDPVTYPNYKYVLDVYVDGSIVQRLSAFPDPTHKLGRFDVSTVLRDYMPSYGFDASGNQIYYDIRKAYKVKIGEEYDGTLYTNLVVDSSDRYCYKSYVPRPFSNTDIISGRVGASMTNMPETPKTLTAYKDDDWLLMPFFDNVTGVTVSCELNDGASVVGGGTYDFVFGQANKLMQCNVSFNTVATALGLSQTEKNSVRQLIVTNNASNVYKFNFGCSKYPTKILVWLNQYGAYELQSFGFVSKKTGIVSRKEFAQLPYTFNASGVVSYDSNNVYYGGKRSYATNTKTSLFMTSHLMADDEYAWIGEMFSSPDVYLYLDDIGKFVPVVITETNYEYNTYLNGRLRPLQFTVQFPDEYNAQYL